MAKTRMLLEHWMTLGFGAVAALSLWNIFTSATLVQGLLNGAQLAAFAILAYGIYKEAH